MNIYDVPVLVQDEGYNTIRRVVLAVLDGPEPKGVAAVGCGQSEAVLVVN